MEKWVALLKTKEEKLEAYKKIETVLSEYEELKAAHRSFEGAVRRRRLGVLDDYHVSVLHALLAHAAPGHPDYLKTLATLSTRRQQFDHSAARFREYVDVTQNNFLEEIPNYRTKDYYMKTAFQAQAVGLAPAAVSHWRADLSVDAARWAARDDFTRPLPPHAGAAALA
eukprot:CAMPEP_0206392272 /NCGR_PEP_ID=MMETSP0294-20121207/19863_1 /ASSEMBLY_ACC=CAM_ASM_000327 /TAXON_ID=39354 /ORGANISM="Heterosigma akashiwo, Strain CCMP2393" /LENGTH=168 /DNA_ID=CAMNT_0053845325 /DNA_START=200 /DNA_END=702 /DNA_ORIENTATION=+